MFILHAHLVLVTRTGTGCSPARHLDRMEQIMRDVRAYFGTELVKFNREPEHVQVNVLPTVAISRLASSLNGVVLPQAAAGVPRPATPLLAGETAVAGSYFADSADGAPISILR